MKVCTFSETTDCNGDKTKVEREQNGGAAARLTVSLCCVSLIRVCPLPVLTFVWKYEARKKEEEV